MPIIQSPMAGAQDSRLAIAVCEAGGLGSVPCGMLNAEQIVNEIRAVRSATDKPFNLNFFCHEMPEFDIEKQLVWQDTLAPYFAEMDIECPPPVESASRMPFNHEIADAIEPFNPEIISFHFGLPDKDLMKRVKGWGSRVLSSATTLDEAVWLEENGVDGIIAQGYEAGGHRGMFLSDDLSAQVGMFSLARQITQSVNVPVIAAGGIADAEGVAAAMKLGVDAVQVGTAFLLCDEATTGTVHRKALQQKRAQYTALTNLFSGRPARGIVNRAMSELGYLNESAPAFPYAATEITQLRQRFESAGRDDFTPLWCGQNVSGCKSIPAAELLKQLAANIA